MTFKLNANQAKERDTLIDSLREHADLLMTGIREYNDIIERKNDDILELLKNYNGILEEARVFADKISTSTAEALDEKSDAWKESEKGEAAQNFQSEWDNVDLYDFEIELPQHIDQDEPDHATILEELPEE